MGRGPSDLASGVGHRLQGWLESVRLRARRRRLEQSVASHSLPPFSRRPLFEALEQRLLLSATIAGAIDTPGETDRYSLTLEQDQLLYFDALSNSNLNWSLSGPRGTIVPNRAIGSSDSSDFNGNPMLSVAAGEYLLTVDGIGDATGSYSFRLLEPSDAQPVTPGAAVNGKLDPASSTALYSFDATAGERFYFDMQSVGNAGGDWRLIDPFGGQIWSRPLASDVDVQQLGFTGTYLLMVEGRSLDAGTNAFRFNVQPVSDDSSTLTLAQRVDGAISHTGQVDRYSFTLVQRTQVVFDALSDSPLTWSLTGPRGQAVKDRAIRASDAGQFGNNPVLDLVAGDYTLLIDGLQDATGNYAFELIDLASGSC